MRPLCPGPARTRTVVTAASLALAAACAAGTLLALSSPGRAATSPSTVAVEATPSSPRTLGTVAPAPAGGARGGSGGKGATTTAAGATTAGAAASFSTPQPRLALVLQNPSFSTLAVDRAGTGWGLRADGTAPNQLYRTADEGRTWTAAGALPAGSTVQTISVLSTGTLIASANTGGGDALFRSTDGTAWTQVLAFPTTPVLYGTLTAHSITDAAGFAYVGTYNTGTAATNTNYLYRSADDGRTWAIVNTSTTHRHIHAVQADPSTGRVYVNFGDRAGDGWYVSTDQGVTLTPLCTSYSCVSIDIAFDGAGGALFGSDNPDVQNHAYRLDLGTGATTDRGRIGWDAWSAFRVGPGLWLLGSGYEGFNMTDPNLHLYASADDGATFTDVFERPIPGTNGVWKLQVQYAYPSGDFPILVSGYGTVVAHLSAGSTPTKPPRSTVPPQVRQGAPAPGSELRGTTGGWTGDPLPVLSFQWQRCSAPGSCAPIAGATGIQYTATSADVGFTLRLAVTGTSDLGSLTVASAETATVAAGAVASQVAQFGGTQPGFATSSSGASYRYGTVFALPEPGTLADLRVWGRGGSASQSFTPLVYATDSTGAPSSLVAQGQQFTVAAGQAAGWISAPLPAVTLQPGSYLVGLLSGTASNGAFLSLDVVPNASVYAFNSGSQPPSSFGAASSEDVSWAFAVDYAPQPGAATFPASTSPPTVSGTAAAGSTLTVATGSWTNAPTILSIRWRRCSSTGTSCTDVPGATGTTYAVTSADAGSALVAEVVATNAGGSATASSAPTAVVGGGGTGGFFTSFATDPGCSACTAVENPTATLTAHIGGGADTVDTALGSADVGGASGLSGRVYTRDLIGLAPGQVLNGNLAVTQVTDVGGSLVWELYIAPDRTLRLWSPPGALGAAPINLSTGAVVPNDGTTTLRAEVSAQANASVTVRVNGVDAVTATGLSGATTGNQRYLRAGVDHYDTSSASEPVGIVHASVAVSQSGWIGAPGGGGGGFFDTLVTDAGCSGCSAVESPTATLTASIAGGVDSLDTAFGQKDFGGSAGWTGTVYTREYLSLAQGQVLNGNLAVTQVTDTAGSLVWELYVAPDRTLRLWSPAGGLRSASINLSTGALVPNDGTSSIRVEVAAQANGLVDVRVNGSDLIALSGLAGATTGAQRTYRAGIDHYDTATSAEPVRAVHASCAVSASGFIGP